MGKSRFSGEVSVSGSVDLADNDVIRFGTDDDCELFCDGTDMVMDLNSGINNFIIRDGTTTKFTFDDSGLFTAGGVQSNSALEARTGTKFIRSVSLESQNLEFLMDSLDNRIVSNGDKPFRFRVHPGQDFIVSTRDTPTSSAGYVDRLSVNNLGQVVISGLSGSGTANCILSSTGRLARDSSDARLKTNVKELPDQTEVVKQLRPVSFNWVDTEDRGEQTEIGFIAQEVEPLIPEVVGINFNGEGEEDTMYVNYHQVVATLTKALQESISRIEELETRVKELEEQ